MVRFLRQCDGKIFQGASSCSMVFQCPFYSLDLQIVMFRQWAITSHNTWMYWKRGQNSLLVWPSANSLSVLLLQTHLDRWKWIKDYDWGRLPTSSQGISSPPGRLQTAQRWRCRGRWRTRSATSPSFAAPCSPITSLNYNPLFSGFWNTKNLFGQPATAHQAGQHLRARDQVVIGCRSRVDPS